MTVEHGSHGSEVSRQLLREENVSASSSTLLSETRQRQRPRCALSDCGQVFLTLRVVETLGCICHSTERVFRERVAAFERRYGLDKISPSRSCVVECGSCDEHDFTRQPSGSKEILHPGDAESSVRDRLAISNIFGTLAERGASTNHQHVYFTLSGEQM